jgi:hypothetical protein
MDWKKIYLNQVFLKNNISMSLNNNSNLEKDIEFNNIKKINLNIKIK